MQREILPNAQTIKYHPMSKLTDAQDLSRLLSLAIDEADRGELNPELRAMLLAWHPVVDGLIQYFSKRLDEPGTLRRIQCFALEDVTKAVTRLCRYALNLGTPMTASDLRGLMREALNKLEEVGKNLSTPLQGSELQHSTAPELRLLRNQLYDLEHMLKAECEAIELGHQASIPTELYIQIRTLYIQINKL